MGLKSVLDKLSDARGHRSCLFNAATEHDVGADHGPTKAIRRAYDGRFQNCRVAAQTGFDFEW